MATKISRFDIHDELTAPPESAPILKGALSGQRQAQQLRRRAGRLAGRAARLRAHALRAAARHAAARDAGADRARGGRVPRLRVRRRGARARRAQTSGSSLDEVDHARPLLSRDEQEAALLRYLESVLENRGAVPIHLHEEAREQGWTRRADPRGARSCGARGLLGARDARRRDPARGHRARGQAAQEGRLAADAGSGADT